MNSFHFQPTSNQPPTFTKSVSTIAVNDYTIPAIEKSLLEMDCKSIKIQNKNNFLFSGSFPWFNINKYSNRTTPKK
jgi:hypothetical protein